MFKSNTAELSGLTVQLDQLHTAYRTIFEEAQRQLEGLEMTDEQVNRICERLANRDDVVRKVQAEAISQLANSLTKATEDDLEETYETRKLLDALERRIWQRISNGTMEAVTGAMEELMEQQIPQLIEEKFKANTKLQQGAAAEFVLQGLAAYLQTVPVPPKKPEPQ